MCCIPSQLLGGCICQGQQRYICEHVEYVPVQCEYTAAFNLIYTIISIATHELLSL